MSDALAQIRDIERAVAAAIDEATSEAAAAVAEARRRADEMIVAAEARGTAAAERRYRDGMIHARDEARRILDEADAKVAALRRQAAAHVPTAVDAVMAIVLAAEEV